MPGPGRLPSAGELLRRHPVGSDREALTPLLAEWERWSAELLESHLSYPVLAYFRSQHGNQSWLAALTTILDTSALLQVASGGLCARQAQLTFAMARHAVVDLAQVFSAPKPETLGERLSEGEFAELIRQLDHAGMTLGGTANRDRFSELRLLYEPYVAALSRYLALPCRPGLATPIVPTIGRGRRGRASRPGGARRTISSRRRSRRGPASRF